MSAEELLGRGDESFRRQWVQIKQMLVRQCACSEGLRRWGRVQGRPRREGPTWRMKASWGGGGFEDSVGSVDSGAMEG
jgi:antibiotic biosynthesis monooxygenase (ABM) superfamily enzyme